MDRETAEDINRDKAEQSATEKFEAWKATEEYANAVQLKYEAMLADPDMLAEAIGPDGIQYPKECKRALWEDTRRLQIAHENSIYYPHIGQLVLQASRDMPDQNIDINNDESRAASILIGRMMIEQIGKYLHKTAVDQVEENY